MNVADGRSLITNYLFYDFLIFDNVQKSLSKWLSSFFLTFWKTVEQDNWSCLCYVLQINIIKCFTVRKFKHKQTRRVLVLLMKVDITVFGVGAVLLADWRFVAACYVLTVNAAAVDFAVKPAMSEHLLVIPRVAWWQRNFIFS